MTDKLIDEAFQQWWDVEGTSLVDYEAALIGWRAALAAIEAQGRVLVPRTPTEAMLLAVEESNIDTGGSWQGYPVTINAEEAEHVYRIMIAAAPKQEEPGA
jgi:hypothetical protein